MVPNGPHRGKGGDAPHGGAEGVVFVDPDVRDLPPAWLQPPGRYRARPVGGPATCEGIFLVPQMSTLVHPRHGERERGTLTRLTLDRHTAPMRLDEFLCNGKPQAHALPGALPERLE